MLDSGKTFLNLQDIADSIAKFGNYTKVAKEFETTPAEVAQAAHEARQAGIVPSDEAKIERYERLTANKVVKLRPGQFGKDEIIADMVRIFEETGSITHTKFDNFSKIPVSDLMGHFGNFAEAMRQAGLKPPTSDLRTQTALAKIAAAEKFKPHIEKLREAGSAYDRWLGPNNKSIHILVISDTHDVWMDPLVRRAFLDQAASGQYHHIILNGDIYDMYEVSKYEQSPQWMDFKVAWAFNRQFLYELREAAPDAQIDLIEGNHEFRLIKKCIEVPAMAEILGVTGLDLPAVLGLDGLNINYVGVKDLRMPEKQKWATLNDAPQGKIYYDSFLATHLPNFFRKAGMPGTHGHTHKYEAIPKWSATHGNHHWWVTGAGCIRKAEYARGGTMLWNSGFLTVTINRVKHPAYVKAQWHQADIDIQVNGKTYVRTEEEFVGSDDVVEYNRRIVRP